MKLVHPRVLILQSTGDDEIVLFVSETGADAATIESATTTTTNARQNRPLITVFVNARGAARVC